MWRAACQVTPRHMPGGARAMLAAGLACCQLITAAWIFRKLPWPRPPWIPALHRWTGRLAIVFVLPVLYWCIFQLGFQTFDTRYVAHSLLGTLAAAPRGYAGGRPERSSCSTASTRLG
jgi:hypothetical protein